MKNLYTSALAVAGLLAAQTNAMRLETEAAAFTEISVAEPEYRYAKKRCNAKQKRRANECEAWCEGTSEPTIGCAWSTPLDEDIDGGAACRCVPQEYFYAKNAVNESKCGGCEEG